MGVHKRAFRALPHRARAASKVAAEASHFGYSQEGVAPRIIPLSNRPALPQTPCWARRLALHAVAPIQPVIDITKGGTRAVTPGERTKCQKNWIAVRC
jgi:hypothetical protein